MPGLLGKRLPPQLLILPLQEAAAELAMLVEPVFFSKHEAVVLQLCDILVKLYTAYPVQHSQDQNARVSHCCISGSYACMLHAKFQAELRLIRLRSIAACPSRSLGPNSQACQQLCA